jgi:type IV secretory pathway VirB10-like protein
MRKLMFVALAGALALSACGKKKEEQHEVEATNNLVSPPDENVIDADTVQPTPVEPTNSSNATPAAPPKISENQQMLDDAAASGMTARLHQGGDGEPVADQAVAEQDANTNTPDN